MTAIFAAELQKLGAFEVILPPSSHARELSQGIFDENGTMDLDTAIKAHEELHADAFVIGKVTVYKPYDPPALGVRLQIISAKTGDVLWTADAVFDGSESLIRRRARKYFHRRHDGEESLFGWTIVMTSMRRYVQFVSNEILSTLRPS